MSTVVEKPEPPARRKKRQARPAWTDENGSAEVQPEQRREVLFRTAARAFNELGYHATTLDEVARRLNVTKPTLYYYVKDKDDILFECNRLAFEMLDDALRAADDPSRPGLQRLQDFLRRYTELMVSDFGACLIRIGMRPLRPESRAKLRGFANQLDKAVRRMVEQGVADGSIRPCNPKLVSFAVFGGFNGIAGWYRADGEFRAPEVAAQTLELFTLGLAPR